MEKLPFDQFSESYSNRWNSITLARNETEKVKVKLIKLFLGEGELNEDTDLVLFGSIARGERNDESDVDWTLLVDGQAFPSHRETAHRIRKTIIDGGLKSPSPTGFFGRPSFSHDLVHFIGGENESYSYLSQRVLLILESIPLSINAKSGQAYERVINCIISRYLEDDNIFIRSGRGAKIPRFLFNDIVRFWRTMCVDFAWKQKEQEGEKWAIRNIKLRLSRKLIFVSGILMLYECYLLSSSFNNDSNIDEKRNQMMKLLKEYISLTPLDILAKVLPNINKETTIKIFDAYNSFLSLLQDSDKRKHLEELKQENANNDAIFIEGKKIGYDFEDALTEIFFNNENDLYKFIKTYGVF